MTLPATIAALGPMAAALITLLALVCIGILIWSALPARSAKARRDADIERQIKTLRHSADHAVATRPRVRANGYQPVSIPGTVKAPPRNPSGNPKACGGGLCRHRADCSDHHCPGRLAANLSGQSLQKTGQSFTRSYRFSTKEPS